MSLVSWTASGGGSWSVASNWSGGRAPRSSDTVTVAVAGIVTLPASVTVTSLTVSGASTVLALGAASSSLAGGFMLQGGTVALEGDRLALSGAVVFGQAAAAGGAVDGAGTLTTSAASVLAGGSLSLTLGGGAVWVNAGLVTVAGTIGLGDLSGVTAALVNQAGATFDLTADNAAIVDDGVTNAGGTFALGGGSFANAGTLEKTGGGGVDLIYAAVSNTGVITASSGTLELAGGGVLGGAIGGSGGGKVALGSGVFTLATNAVSLTGGLGLVGGEIVLTAGQTLSLAGSVFFGQAAVGGGAVDGPGTLLTAGAISVLADGSPQLMLGDGVTWINSGTVTDGGDISVGDLSGNQAILINAAAGVIDFTADTGAILDDGYLDANGYYWQGSSTLANAGLIEKTAGSGTSAIDAVLSNTGTVTVSSGTLALDGGGVLGGSLGATGAGALAFEAGPLTPGTWTLGTGQLAISGLFDLLAGAITVGAGQTLSFSGTASLDGGVVDGPGTLVTGGVTILDGGTLAGGLAWRNSGTIDVTGVASIADPSSMLTNLPGGTIDFTGDQGAILGRGLITNDGMMVKTAGTLTNYIAATLAANLGTIAASSGTLALEGGGVLGGVIGGTAGGVVALGAGRFSFGGSVFDAGVVAVGGTIGLASGQTIALAAGSAFDGGVVDGAGTLLTSGSLSVNGATLGGGATWVNEAAATLNSVVASGDGSGAGAAIVNQAGGSLLLAVDTAGFTADAQASLLNAGLLAKSAGAGTSRIGIMVDSTGSLMVASGTLELDGGFSLAGSVGGAGTLALASGAGVLQAGLASAAANLLIDGASVAVSGDLAVGGSVTLGAGDLAIGAGDVLTLSGPVAFDGGTIDGPGAVATTGTTSLPLGTAMGLVVGGVWLNDGLASLSGNLVLGDGDSAGTLVNQGTLLLAAAAASISSSPGHGVGVVSNGGLLDAAGGGSSEVAADLVSSGTIEVGSGTLALGDGGMLSGRVLGPGTLALDGGATTLASGVALTVGDLLVSGGTLVVATDAGDIGPVGLVAGTIWLDAGDTLSLADLAIGSVGWGGAAVEGPGTLALIGSTSVIGGGVAALSTGGGAVWLNSGTLSIATTVVGSGPASFINQVGASLLLTADVGGFAGTATLLNNGWLAKVGGGGISHVAAAVSGSGTISASSGTLELDGGGVLAGTIGGSIGVVTLGAGDFTVAASGLTVAGAFGLTGGTLTLAAGQLLTLGTRTLLAGGDVDGPGTLLVAGGGNVLDGLVLGGGGRLANGGTLTVSGTLGIGDPAGGQASLLNQAGALLDLGAGAAIIGDLVGAVGNGTLINAGTLDQVAGSGTIAIAVSNSGTILASGGTLALDDGLSGGGTLALTGGATLQVSAVTGAIPTILVGSGGGTLAMPFGFASLGSNLILDGTGATLAIGASILEQTLTAIAAGGVLNLADGRSYRTALSVRDAGFLSLNGGTLATGGLTIASGGTLAGYGTIAMPVNNAGLVEACFGDLVLSGNSTGRLQIDPTGTLQLAGSVTGCVAFADAAGTLELAAGGGSIGTLTGLGAGDTIVIDGVTSATVTLTGATLTIASAAGTWTASLADDPGAGALRVITSDPTAATMITFAAAAPPAPDDFTGSGASDLLLRASDGSLAIWDVAGLASEGGALLGNPGSQWQVAGVGDFTGGGSDDVLLQTGAGYVELWELQGNNPGTIVTVNAPGGGWQVAATGDFNDDGTSDIVWQNTSGQVAVWEMNGAVPITTAILGSPGSGWLVAGTANLGVPGRTDILLTNSAGAVGLWPIDGLTPGAVTDIGSPGAGWHLAGSAVTGSSDLVSLVWQNAADQVAVWEVGALGPVAGGLLASPGAGWQVAAVGSTGSGGLEVTLQNAQGSIMAMTAQGTALTGSTTLGNPGSMWTVVDR